MGCCLLFGRFMAKLGTANGEKNSFEYFECCLVSLVGVLCSQIYAPRALSTSRTQMPALELCSG
jgi:hypothetical protein